LKAKLLLGELAGVLPAHRAVDEPGGFEALDLDLVFVFVGECLSLQNLERVGIQAIVELRHAFGVDLFAPHRCKVKR
jgi:hypothetical protein